MTIINTAAGFVTRIANLIARFVLQTILIYVLGIQYVGVSGTFTSVLTVLSLADLGIGSAISYELYKPLAEKNEKKIAALMNFYKMAYRIVAIVVLVIGVTIIPFLHLFIKDVPDIKENIALIYMMFVIKTFVTYLLVYKSTLLVAKQENYIVSKIQAIMTLVRSVAECVALLLTGQYITYLIIEIVANVIQNVWISNIADKRNPELKKNKKEYLNKAEQKKLLFDIKGLAMYKAAFALGRGVDNIIIGAFVNTSAVGLVSNYTLIRTQVEQFLKQLNNEIVPSVGNLSVTESEDKQHDIFSKLLFLNFWLSAFCSVSYFVIIQPFIILWLGVDYLLSLTIVAAMTMDFYIVCISETVASFRTATGVFVKGQYRPLITVTINIVLSVILARYLGIFGVLIATVIARLLTQWYDPYLLFKIVFKKSPKKFYYKYYTYLLFAIICAIISYGVANILVLDNVLVQIIVRCIICVIIPNLMIILIYRKTDEFKYCCEQMSNIFRKLIRKIKK